MSTICSGPAEFAVWAAAGREGRDVSGAGHRSSYHRKAFVWAQEIFITSW